MPATQTAPTNHPAFQSHRPEGEPALFCHDLEDRALFADNFDRTPFQFRHSLHEMELFQIPALLAAAERLARKNDQKSHYESGEPDVNGWFGSPPQDKTMVQALAEIESGKNWVILKRIHEDPVYGAVLKSLIPELSRLTGVDIAECYYDPTMTIFVTSPGRITPYHMDGETNFLAQVRGPKDVYLYDPGKDCVLSHEQMERYWTGNLPKIDLPEALPQGHWKYRLLPGNGVFNPAVFPHWLQNGPEVSVSVSINFKRRNNATIGAYRTNNYLRKLGLRPTAPGVSPTVDRVKEATFGRLYQIADSTVKLTKSKLKT
jgi:hypothetical protein